MSTAYEQERRRYLPHLEDDGTLKRIGGVGHAFETTPLFSLAARFADTPAPAAQKPSSAKKPQASPEPYNDETSNDTSDETSGATTNDSSSSSEDDVIIPPARGPLNKDILSQYGLLGFHVGDHPFIGNREPIMLNTRAPNSTFLCGSQGSGKSFTLNCMLENYLLPDAKYGSVSNPVAGVVFHYDDDDVLNGAEVAALCSKGIEVNVLVSPSNYSKLEDAYGKLAREASAIVNVDKLLFEDEHLSIDRMHKLMAFQENADQGVPLYVAIINKTLRQMAMSEKPFSFEELEKELDKAGLTQTQRSLLDMRFDLIKSFMVKDTDKAKSRRRNIFKSRPGSLTIVDLSDPFVDASMVCTLFGMCLGLFKQNRPKDGLIIALDEAHKYLNKCAGAERFTEHLITTVRMQRHHATRVVIVTQEPTISGSLLDLCSVSIVHRFTSPAWFQAIKEHLSAASSLVASAAEQKKMFDGIVNLGVGESFVFSPSSFVCLEDRREKKLGTGVMKMKTRKRDGRDFGGSKMAGEIKAMGSVVAMPQLSANSGVFATGQTV